ncbi:MAG: type II secretion system F family protein [Patescibacteria group bacterium]
MPFHYVASNKKGEIKRGTYDLSSRDAVVSDLVRQGLIVISVEEVRSFQRAASTGLAIFGYVSHVDKLLFTKHLAIMLKAGLTLVESLKILEEQATGWSMRRVIGTIGRHVAGGNKFSDGLAKFPRVFTPFYVSIIRAGEESGTMTENLEHLAVQFTKDHELRKKVQTAMLYPVIVFFAASAIGFFFAVYVIPQVAGLFKSIPGIKLPLVTTILLKVADIAQHYTFVTFFGFMGSLAALSWLLSRPFAAPVVHRVTIKLPIFGKIVRDVNLARFALVLGTMLRSGIPITTSVDITAQVLGNVHFRKALYRAKEEMERGNPLSGALAEAPNLYPAIVSRMINIGERTGNLETVLGYLAEFYELEVETATKNLSTALEPLLLLFIGAIALAMAYAILIPIYNFIGAIRRI